MLRARQASLCLIIGSIALISSVEAQFPRSPFGNCGCSAPVVPTIAPRQAYVNPCECAQTTYVPCPQITYRNVTSTCYRPETVSQLVPVTRMKQVTQIEWVPRTVTRSIPETTYQQQLTTRMVPYQVTSHVPQVSTYYQPHTTVYGVTSPIVSQSSYLSTPYVSNAAPRVAGVPTLADPIEPYQPGSNLPPSAEQLDPTLHSYDASSRVGQRGKLTRSATSVFRQYR